ncbi:ferredoxin-NADP reductase, partial [Streptomyces sp. NPDC047968]
VVDDHDPRIGAAIATARPGGRAAVLRGLPRDAAGRSLSFSAGPCAAGEAGRHAQAAPEHRAAPVRTTTGGRRR